MIFADFIEKVSKNKNYKVIFDYEGILTQTLIVSLSDILEKEGDYEKVDMSSLNKLFVVFVEMSQNVMKYSPLMERGMIAVTADDKSYRVFSANIITKKQKEVISKRLQEIKQLDSDGLKKRYREIRKSGIYSHDKGGGIGFYEIARKSNGIKYEFIEDEDGKLWFLLKAIINKKTR